MGLFQILPSFVFLKQPKEGQTSFWRCTPQPKRKRILQLEREDEYLAGQLNATGDVDNTQFIGSAVFRNGVMIGKLNGQETRIVNILDDTTNITDILLNIPDPFSHKQQMAARLLKTGNNQVEMNLTGVKPKITITVPLKFEIMSNPSMTNLILAKKTNKF